MTTKVLARWPFLCSLFTKLLWLLLSSQQVPLSLLLWTLFSLSTAPLRRYSIRFGFFRSRSSLSCSTLGLSFSFLIMTNSSSSFVVKEIINLSFPLSALFSTIFHSVLFFVLVFLYTFHCFSIPYTILGRSEFCFLSRREGSSFMYARYVHVYIKHFLRSAII